MTAGAVVPIHIDDPLQLLQPAASAVDLNCRVQLVTAQGYACDAVIVNGGPASRDLSITVPFNAAYTVRVISPHLAIADNFGQPVTSIGAAYVTSAASNAALIRYSVRGVK
jgi:hypothetical protein